MQKVADFPIIRYDTPELEDLYAKQRAARTALEQADADLKKATAKAKRNPKFEAEAAHAQDWRNAVAQNVANLEAESTQIRREQEDAKQVVTHAVARRVIAEATGAAAEEVRPERGPAVWVGYVDSGREGFKVRIAEERGYRTPSFKIELLRDDQPVFGYEARVDGPDQSWRARGEATEVEPAKPGSFSSFSGMDTTRKAATTLWVHGFAITVARLTNEAFGIAEDETFA